MKRQGKSGARRARRPPRSPKAVAIISLIEAISADGGLGDGVVLGKGVARPLRDVYKQHRGTTPAWVTQLVTHYTGTSRKS